MSYVVAAPEYVAAAAHDLANIGSTISDANAAALVPTSGVVAPGADEVSAIVTALFESHAQAYQALSAQAALFHTQFVQLMSGGAAEYAAAEAANASPLQTFQQAVTSAAPVGSAAAGVPSALVGALPGSAPSATVAPAAGLTAGVSPAPAVSAAAAPVTAPAAAVQAAAAAGPGPVGAPLAALQQASPAAAPVTEAVPPPAAPVEAVEVESAAVAPANALPLPAATSLAGPAGTRAYTPATPAYSPGAGAPAEEQPAG
jgi:PE family